MVPNSDKNTVPAFQFERGYISLPEKVLLLQTTIVVVLCSWWLSDPDFKNSLLVFGVTSLSWVPLYLAYRSGSEIKWKAYAPLLGYCIYLMTSLMNTGPGAAVDVRSISLGGSWINWLPTTSDPERSLSRGLLFAGAIQQGLSLKHLIVNNGTRLYLSTIIIVNCLLLTVYGGYRHATLSANHSYAIGAITGFATFPNIRDWECFSILNAALAAGTGLQLLKQRTQNKETLDLSLLAFASAFLSLSSIVFLGISVSGALAIVIALVVWAKIVGGPSNRATLVLRVVCGFAIPLSLSCAYFAGKDARDTVTDSENSDSRQPRLVGIPTSQFLAQIEKTSDTFRMASERPIWGWGQGTFSREYPAFAGYYVKKNQAIDGKTFTVSPCDWGEFAAEFGYVGLVVVVIIFLYQVSKMCFSRNLVPQWMGLGSISVAIVSLTNSPFHNLPIMITLCVFYSLSTESLFDDYNLSAKAEDSI